MLGMFTPLLAGFALLAVLLPAAAFLRDTRRGAVRPHQPGLRAGALIALVLGLASVVAAVSQGGAWWVTLALSLPAVLTGSLFLFIIAQRRVTVPGIRVDIGGPMRPFQALHADGSPFDSHSLAGQRVLLKFFRGHWCPFCSVELQQFEALRPELERHGIRLIAISKDSPGDVGHHRQRDGLGFTLLSDQQMEVIRDYGLEHRKALEISGRSFKIAGIHMGVRPRFTAMAAPTTLLVDEHGVVRWIDVAEDYKVRSDCQRLLRALEDALPAVRFATAYARSPDDAPAVNPPVYVACQQQQSTAGA